jgi:SAM-dependent methyltransferase
MSRSDREKKAYDEDGIWDHSHRWHMRFAHVFETPNTARMETVFEKLVDDRSRGKRVLEIGSGPGVTAEKIISGGAAYLLGVDVSEKFVALSKEREKPGVMEFKVHDVHAPLEGRFDLVFGRAILHHVDFEKVLKRLYQENLNPGGSMVFVEPLGRNLLLKAYYRLVPKAHTPDERPFFPKDLRWLEKNLPGFRVLPINYLSLPAGIISSLFFPNPDNFLTRAADQADRWIAKNLRFMIPRFRSAIFLFEKSA